ncbi:response regulator transcription factor [Paenibacillus sp. HJGM_3]|uniref:response regulator transcription factor n=1 Tax=Paenibacillus sp. HJGM_3 TaxID=3379816 RepID=UPI0038596C19
MTEHKKILIVEDDASITRVLEIILNSNNFKVYSTAFGEKVNELVAEIQPDLFILDIGLPDANGIDIISVIRQQTQSPIIMLSGKNTDIEKITCFQLGADDYVVKPFSAAELVARIQSLLRRYRYTSPSTPTSEEGSEQSEDTNLFRIDVERHRVFINSQEVSLTNKEFMLFRLLHSKKGKVLSREVILDNVWGIDNLDVETRAVDACASRLRKKIKAVLDKDIIEGVPGTGYRFLED